MVAMVIFGLTLGSVFLLFGIGHRGFRTVESRQSGQNQLAAVRAAIQQDFQVTHFYGIAHRVGPSRRLEGAEVPRHVISAVALTDWERSDSVNSYGLPNWDRWAVYRVTNEDRGVLVRHLVEPRNGAKGRSLLREAEGLAELSLSAEIRNPTWGRVVSASVLARDVKALEMRRHDRERAVSLTLTLEQPKDPKNPRSEVFSATFYVKPHNTVPVD